MTQGEHLDQLLGRIDKARGRAKRVGKAKADMLREIFKAFRKVFEAADRVCGTAHISEFNVSYCITTLDFQTADMAHNIRISNEFGMRIGETYTGDGAGLKIYIVEHWPELLTQVAEYFAETAERRADRLEGQAEAGLIPG